MTIRYLDPGALSADINAHLGALAEVDLDQALDWLKTTMTTEGVSLERPVWVYEDAVQRLIQDLLEHGRRGDAVELATLFSRLETQDLALSAEATLPALEAIRRSLDVLSIGYEADEAQRPARVSADGLGRGPITIRPPSRSELPAFLESMRNLVEAEAVDGASGSFAAYAPEALSGASSCYLMAEDESGIVGGCAMVNYDSEFAEFAPAVVAPALGGLRLGYLLTLLHCVRQSFLDPDRKRVYWSAVPTANPADAQRLRRCGFSARGDLWSTVGNRFEEPGLAGKASWLAASPRVIARKFLGAVEALDDGPAATWGQFLEETRGALDVRVILGGAPMGVGDLVPVAREVASFG